MISFIMLTEKEYRRLKKGHGRKEELTEWEKELKKIQRILKKRL